MSPKIFWSGYNPTLKKNEGYKNSQDEIILGLQKLGLDIESKYTISDEIRPILDAGVNIEYVKDPEVDTNADILINNRLPTEYRLCNGYNIGFTYWETEQLPKIWVERMNMMDEIWTTSKWAEEMFIRSGVKVPVYSFRLGVNIDLFFPKKRVARKPFTFMSIGAPSTRKNSQIAVSAFTKLFGHDENYRLLYKCIGEPDARLHPDSPLRASIYNHSRIDVVEKDLPIDELSDLYDSVDCVLYPTSGEGWGLMPYQSIAKGIPTICTNATSCTEFAEWSVPLGFKYSQYNMSGIYSDAGVWAEPDFDDLCDKMLYVVNNYEDVATHTYNNAVNNFPIMGWDYAAKGYYDRICQILKNLKIKL